MELEYISLFIWFYQQMINSPPASSLPLLQISIQTKYLKRWRSHSILVREWSGGKNLCRRVGWRKLLSKSPWWISTPNQRNTSLYNQIVSYLFLLFFVQIRMVSW